MKKLFVLSLTTAALLTAAAAFATRYHEVKMTESILPPNLGQLVWTLEKVEMHYTPFPNTSTTFVAPGPAHYSVKKETLTEIFVCPVQTGTNWGKGIVVVTKKCDEQQTSQAMALMRKGYKLVSKNYESPAGEVYSILKNWKLFQDKNFRYYRLTK